MTKPLHRALADAHCAAREKFGVRDSIAIAAATLRTDFGTAALTLGFPPLRTTDPAPRPNDIVIEPEFPPVPSRAYDWAAHRRDWDAEENVRGFGPTPLAAAINLQEIEEAGL